MINMWGYMGPKDAVGRYRHLRVMVFVSEFWVSYAFFYSNAEPPTRC